MLKQERLLSLDVFRGLTMAAMILVENPGSYYDTYLQFRHAKWGDFPTFTDLIFPFFLFIVGISITISFAKRKEAEENIARLVKKILKRSLILFLLGLLIYLFPFFNFSRMRIPGVLQCIAVVYLICSLLSLKTSWRIQTLILISVLLGSWLLLTQVPVPGMGAANLKPDTNLASWLDTLLLKGHLRNPNSDPEGVLTTLSAVSTCLLGMLTGHWILTKNKPNVKAISIFLSGIFLTLLGLLWNLSFPMIKDLWTGSYMLYTGGLALVCFTLCYWIIDVSDNRRWTSPFSVYGINCIAVYVVSQLVYTLISYGIVFTSPDGQRQSFQSLIYDSFFASWLSPANASLVFSLSVVLFWFIPLWFLYKKKIIIKI